MHPLRVLPLAVLGTAIMVSQAQGSGSGCLFSQISTGAHHSCGIAEGGAAVCWGADAYGGSTPPSGEFIAVATGGSAQLQDGNHACGLRKNGTVTCWGSPIYPPSSPPAGTFTRIDSEDGRTCGLRGNGTVECWALQGNIEPSNPIGTFGRIAAAWEGGCGILTNGAVRCWDSDDPQQDPLPGQKFIEIDVSDGGRCGVQTDGSLRCWNRKGYNDPLPDLPEGKFEKIALGDQHGCALRDNGEIACWILPLGANWYGQATPPPGPFIDVSAGGLATCGLRSDSSVECWGYNRHGETVSAPPDRGAFVKTEAADTYGCGLRENGTIDCWGEPDFATPAESPHRFVDLAVGPATCGLTELGEIVCAGFEPALETLLPLAPGPFRRITVELGIGCGLRPSGEIRCWGSSPLAAAAPPPGLGFLDVDGNQSEECALGADHHIVCWKATSGPTAPLSDAVAQMDFGGTHGCAVDFAGDAHCWGQNGWGQASPGAEPYREMAVGDDHTCAIRVDGTLDCWGKFPGNWYGEWPGDYAQISSGGDSNCSLDTGGVVRCWGAIEQIRLPSCIQASSCGDGRLAANEECDDGDDMYATGDACTASCHRVPCGQPLHPLSGSPSSSDALYVLRASVSSTKCDIRVCDTGGDGAISASDALRTLRHAVRSPAPLYCL